MNMVLIFCINNVYRGICLKMFLVTDNDVHELKKYIGMEQVKSLIYC